MSYPPSSPFPPPPPDDNGGYPPQQPGGYPDGNGYPPAAGYPDDGYQQQTPPVPSGPPNFGPPAAVPNEGYPPPPGFPPPSNGGISKGPLIIGIAVGAVVLVCVAAIVIVTNPGGIFGGGDDSGHAGGGGSGGGGSSKMDESIKDEFDKNNAEFYDVTDGVADAKLQLSDGEYYPDGNSGSDSHTEVASDPVYSDADDDGDLDVAMLLENTGDPGDDNGWKSVQIWLWDDGVQPVKEYATWQWNSVSTKLEVDAGADNEGFSINRDAYNLDDDSEPETVDVMVEDDTPVIKYDEERGAIETCWAVGDDKDVDVTGASDPLLLPDSSAAPLGGSQDKVIVSVESDWDEESYNGFVIVVVQFSNGDEGCGWIPYEDYKAAK